ncbi:MAG: TolC family protein [Clostridium sp.]
MNPAADKAQAVANSYTMKVNKRKLENAKSDDTKETLEKTIREDTQTHRSFRNLSSYQNVLAAKASMDLKGAQAQLQEKTMQTTERQYQLGMIGKLDYLEQKVCIRFCRDPGTDCKV